VHEDAPFEVDHRDLHAARAFADVEPVPGVAVRVVRRTQEVLLAVEDVDAFLFVPDVVAGGVAVDRQVGDLGQDFGGDPEAAGGVLDVDHDEVRPVVVDQPGEDVLERPAAGLSDDVTDE